MRIHKSSVSRSISITYSLIHTHVIVYSLIAYSYRLFSGIVFISVLTVKSLFLGLKYNIYKYSWIDIRKYRADSSRNKDTDSLF